MSPSTPSFPVPTSVLKQNLSESSMRVLDVSTRTLPSSHFLDSFVLTVTGVSSLSLRILSKCLCYHLYTWVFPPPPEIPPLNENRITNKSTNNLRQLDVVACVHEERFYEVLRTWDIKKQGLFCQSMMTPNSSHDVSEKSLCLH